MARRRGSGTENLSKHFQQGFANRMGVRAANRVAMRPTPMEIGRRRAVATSPALAAVQARRVGVANPLAMMAARRAAMAAPVRVAVRPPMVVRPRIAVRRPGLPGFGGLPQRRGY